MEVLACPYDKSVTVVVVYKEDEEYEAARPYFEDNLAFAALGIEPQSMVLDGEALKEDWFSEDHLLVIMAHELGHLKNNSCDETEADITGFKILSESGLSESAVSLYTTELQARYGTTFETLTSQNYNIKLPLSKKEEKE